MKPGEIYIFKPFTYEYNPERICSPRIGLFLEMVRDHSGWRASKYKILGKTGIEELWSNRWSCDPVPEFMGEE